MKFHLQGLKTDGSLSRQEAIDVLHAHFSQFGEIEPNGIRVMLDSDKGVIRGYGE